MTCRLLVLIVALSCAGVLAGMLVAIVADLIGLSDGFLVAFNALWIYGLGVFAGKEMNRAK